MAIAHTSAATGAAATENTVMVSSTARLVGDAGAPMIRAGTNPKNTRSTVSTNQISATPRVSGRRHHALTREPSGSSDVIALGPPRLVVGQPTVNVPDMYP